MGASALRLHLLLSPRRRSSCPFFGAFASMARYINVMVVAAFHCPVKPVVRSLHNEHAVVNPIKGFRMSIHSLPMEMNLHTYIILKILFENDTTINPPSSISISQFRASLRVHDAGQINVVRTTAIFPATMYCSMSVQSAWAQHIQELSIPQPRFLTAIGNIISSHMCQTMQRFGKM